MVNPVLKPPPTVYWSARLRVKDESGCSGLSETRRV